MTHRIRPVMLVLCLVLVPTTTWAQGLLIDLAAIAEGKTNTLAITPRGEGSVTVINLMPTKNYSYEFRLVTIPIEPQSMPTATPAPTGVTSESICTKTEEFVFGRLTAATVDSETGVAKEIQKLRKEVGDCPAPRRAEIQRKALAEIARITTRTFPAPAIGAGQQLEVVIKEEKRIWTMIFATGARGSWRTLSALAFTPDRNETFHTTASGTVFQIEKDRRGGNDLSFVPSVLFTWLPASKENTDHSHGPTIGLGFSKTTPSVLGGYQWTYNQNIGIAAGIMLQRQTRLARQYEGDALPTVKEALKPEQLTREIYRANFFVALTIRLDKVFSGSDAKAEPKK